MIAHLWELRADPTPLETGARQWARVATDLAATADDIVDAARHALDQGWESESAESYELHRRQMVAQIDTFTTIAAEISRSLNALALMLTAAQEELDRAWVPVAVVPHDLVGAERVLVLHPATPADQKLVRAATDTAREIRSRLDRQLYDEASRLRAARMDLSSVTTDLAQVSGGAWATGVNGTDVMGNPVGTGLVGTDGTTAGESDLLWGDASSVPGGISTSVAGATAGGVAAGAAPSLPPIAPISVSMPELTGLSAAALAGGAGGIVGGAAARRGRARDKEPAPGTGMAPMGGMAAGAAVRGGSIGRPGAGARVGKPVLSGEDTADERAARLAREKEAAREAKRDLIAQRQAERAARRAQRNGDPQKKDADEKDTDRTDDDEQPVAPVVAAVTAEVEQPAAPAVSAVAPDEDRTPRR